MSTTTSEESQVACALVCSRTGVVLGASDAQLDPRLEELAAAARELFDAGATTDFAALFAELGSRERKEHFHELVMISPERIQVVQRSLRHPEATLVAICEHRQKLGLLLSNVRAHLAALESAP